MAAVIDLAPAERAERAEPAARSPWPTPSVAPATYRRRQVVALAVAALMVWLVVSTGVTLASWARGPAVPDLGADGTPAVHVVRPGETIWSIARDLQPRGDIRPLVDLILVRNGGDADLVVGQQLVLVP